MIRRLLPLITVILAVLVDTSILPVFYHGTLIVSVCFCVSVCIGLLTGRIRGLVYGMIGGLLIDITCGTLGVSAFACMSAGFLAGLILVEEESIGVSSFRFYYRRLVLFLLLSTIIELVLGIYHYMLTSSMSLMYAGNAALRVLISSGLTFLLCFPLSGLYHRKQTVSKRSYGKQREVRHF